VLGYGGGKISIKGLTYMLMACLLILNVGACHAQDNITNNNQTDYQTNLHAAAGDAQTPVTTGNVVTAAKTVKGYAEKNNAIPSTVQVGSQNVTKGQFTYLMAQAILNINNGKPKATISPIAVSPTPIRYLGLFSGSRGVVYSNTSYMTDFGSPTLKPPTA